MKAGVTVTMVLLAVLALWLIGSTGAEAGRQKRPGDAPGQTPPAKKIADKKESADSETKMPDSKMLRGVWIQSKKGHLATITFTGDKFVMTLDKKKVYGGTYKLDPDKKPKTIDMIISDGRKSYLGKTSLGIYAFEEGRLIWCANEPGKTKRPSAFTETEGKETYLLIRWKREK